MRTLLAAALFLAFATTSIAETIYKYRSANGKMHYTNRPMKGAELIEAFEYTPPPAPPASESRTAASKSDAAGEQRIKKHLAALEAAWVEVQASGAALASAEEALAAGVTPGEGDMQGIVGSANPAPPSAGGPQAPAPPSAGGPPIVQAPPSAGGPMAGNVRRGSGPSPEYRARLAQLESAVTLARQRNQDAWSRYNKLR